MGICGRMFGLAGFPEHSIDTQINPWENLLQCPAANTSTFNLLCIEPLIWSNEPTGRRTSCHEIRSAPVSQDSVIRRSFSFRVQSLSLWTHVLGHVVYRLIDKTFLLHSSLLKSILFFKGAKKYTHSIKNQSNNKLVSPVSWKSPGSFKQKRHSIPRNH
jgi:hypothetical protein